MKRTEENFWFSSCDEASCAGLSNESGMEDLYTRAWCLVEYIYATWLHPSRVQRRQAIFLSEAKKFGFYKDKVLITGPNDFSDAWPARDAIFGNMWFMRIM